MKLKYEMNLELIPQFVIDYFDENLDTKISNNTWFVSYYNRIMTSSASSFDNYGLNSENYSESLKYIITNKNDLDKHFTITFKGDVMNPNFFTSEGVINLSPSELEDFNTKIKILKCENLANLINKNVASNDLVQKKIKI